MAAVLAFLKQIEQVIFEKGLELRESVELLLQLNEDDSQTCGYYFIDHTDRTMFWLHEVSTEDFGLLPVMSASHLSA
jgi:hypothetical protein